MHKKEDTVRKSMRTSVREQHERAKERHEKVKRQFAEAGEAVKESVKEKVSHPLVNKIIVLFIILFALWEILLYLHGSSYITIPDVFLNSSRAIIIILVTILASSLAVRLTSDRIFRLFEGEVDIEYRIFLAKLYAFCVYVFAVLLILYLLGLSLDQLTLGLTFLATGIAFAIREVLLSYFVWAILLTKKPFRIGDVIAFGEDVGEVKRIGTFYVSIAQTDGSIVKLPNKLFLEKNFVVHGERFNECIMIRIARPPQDAADGFKFTKQALKQVVVVEPSVNLRSNVDSLHLLIEYPVEITNRFKTRSLVLAKLSDLHKDVIVYKTA